MPIHPATKILIWLGGALAVQGAGLVALALASMFVVLALIMKQGAGLGLHMLQRARWLLLSLLFIYAFATPGDLLFPAFGAIGPSLQGLHGGGLQAWRLALLLLGLALLMHTCEREHLLSGLYVLLRPFVVLGLDVERIAVRLWLTLHYAQERPNSRIRDWHSELHFALDPVAVGKTEVLLELQAFTWRDPLLLTLSAALALLAVWSGWMS